MAQVSDQTEELESTSTKGGRWNRLRNRLIPGLRRSSEDGDESSDDADGDRIDGVSRWSRSSRETGGNGNGDDDLSGFMGPRFARRETRKPVALTLDTSRPSSGWPMVSRTAVFPSAAAIAASPTRPASNHSHSDLPPFQYSKPRRIPGLVVGFVNRAPEIIGVGGDEAEEPAAVVGARKRMMIAEQRQRQQQHQQQMHQQQMHQQQMHQQQMHHQQQQQQQKQQRQRVQNPQIFYPDQPQPRNRSDSWSVRPQQLQHQMPIREYRDQIPHGEQRYRNDGQPVAACGDAVRQARETHSQGRDSSGQRSAGNIASSSTQMADTIAKPTETTTTTTATVDDTGKNDSENVNAELMAMMMMNDEEMNLNLNLNFENEIQSARNDVIDGNLGPEIAEAPLTLRQQELHPQTSAKYSEEAEARGRSGEIRSASSVANAAGNDTLLQSRFTSGPESRSRSISSRRPVPTKPSDPVATAAGRIGAPATAGLEQMRQEQDVSHGSVHRYAPLDPSVHNVQHGQNARASLENPQASMLNHINPVRLQSRHTTLEPPRNVDRDRSRSLSSNESDSRRQNGRQRLNNPDLAGNNTPSALQESPAFRNVSTDASPSRPKQPLPPPDTNALKLVLNTFSLRNAAGVQLLPEPPAYPHWRRLRIFEDQRPKATAMAASSSITTSKSIIKETFVARRRQVRVVLYDTESSYSDAAIVDQRFRLHTDPIHSTTVTVLNDSLDGKRFLLRCIDAAGSSDEARPQGLVQILHKLQEAVRKTQTISTFHFSTVEDLHAFQLAISSQKVYFDNVGSFSIPQHFSLTSLARKAKNKVKQHSDSSNINDSRPDGLDGPITARMQLVKSDHDPTTRLLIFPSHGAARCIHLDSRDFFEIAEDNNGSSCVKLLQVKVSDVAAEEAQDDSDDDVGRGRLAKPSHNNTTAFNDSNQATHGFLTVAASETADEHEDVVITFEDAPVMESFIAALPAQVKQSRGFRLRRKSPDDD